MPILTPGAILGGYRIVEPLGRGGMATVFKAYEAALDRYVALKVLPAEFLHETEFAARFEREAKVIAKLEHPNIVPIFAFGIEQGIPWMSMRLIAGGSLSSLLKSRDIPRETAVGIVRAVGDALSYAHARGVVHRDVKPQNILLDEHGRVYLADFGIARIVEGGTSITRTGMVSGTPQYMAPEQATGQSLDHRMDIYALGIVAYELLTGSAPFSADTPVAVLMKQVSAPIPIPPPDLVPESMLGPILKCLAKNPAERWDSAAEFADALQKGSLTATTQVAAPELPPPPRRPEPRSPRGPQSERPGSSVGLWVVALGLSALALVALIVGLAWLWLRPGEPSAEGRRSGSSTGLSQSTPTPTTLAAPPVTEATPAAPSSSPPPRALVPTAPPPLLPRATPEARAPSAAPTPSLAPPSTATPQTTLPPSTPAPVPPPRPAGHPFRLNERIDVGSPVVGPITLWGARFSTPKPGELELQLDFQCAKGKDQMVTYDASVLDDAGQVLLTFAGKKGVEEKEKATVKLRRPMAPGLLEAAKSFRVTFTSVPD